MVCHKKNGVKTGIFCKIRVDREWQINDGGVSDLIRLFPHDPLRVFIAAQPDKAGAPEMPVRRSFLKFDLRKEQRL